MHKKMKKKETRMMKDGSIPKTEQGSLGKK